MLPATSSPHLEKTAEAPAENPAEAPATPEPAPAPGDEPAQEGQDEGTEDAPPAEDPAPAGDPSAAAAPPRLTAFQRGSLRMLGIGGLVARVEQADAEIFAARAEISLLQQENTRLTARLAEVERETPRQIEAADAARENAVSQGVRAELTALGITADAAPAQLSPEQAEKILSFQEFQQLTHEQRNDFMRQGGKIAKQN